MKKDKIFGVIGIIIILVLIIGLSVGNIIYFQTDQTGTVAPISDEESDEYTENEEITQSESDYEIEEDNTYPDSDYGDDDNIPLSEMGFYYFDGMDLIEIHGYEDGYVYGALKSDSYSTSVGLSFSNGQIKRVQFNSKEDIIYNSGQMIYIRPYSIFDNDSISYGGEYTLTIVERKVIDKNRVIFIMSRNGSKEWYVPRDLLDCFEIEGYSFEYSNGYKIEEDKGFKIPWKYQ